MPNIFIHTLRHLQRARGCQGFKLHGGPDIVEQKPKIRQGFLRFDCLAGAKSNKDALSEGCTYLSEVAGIR